MGRKRRSPSPAPAPASAEQLPQSIEPGTGRKRRSPSPSPSLEQSPQSIEPSTRTAPATRSVSTPLGNWPTVQRVVSSGSQWLSKMRRRPSGMPASLATPSSTGEAAAGGSIGAEVAAGASFDAQSEAPEPASPDWEVAAGASFGTQLVTPEAAELPCEAAAGGSFGAQLVTLERAPSGEEVHGVSICAQLVTAERSPVEAAARVSIGAQLVTPEPASALAAGGGEEFTWPPSALTAVGEELTWPHSASPAGGEEVEPMLELEETAAGAFLPNSPIRVPYLLEYDSNGELCEEPSLFPDPVLMEPYEKAEQEYSDKIAQIRKLPTLDSDTSISPTIIQESAADTILEASAFVLGLSSYVDGELLRKCSGILMEWSKGTGTILTTAQLICSRSPNVDEWLGDDEYDLNAEVRVQLLHTDDFEMGQLMYLDKQYGFALFRVLMDEPKKLPRFSNERFAQDVFLLGRCESNLQIGNGKVLSKGAGSYERHHYMYTDGQISPRGAGGAVINLEGDVTGMITSSIHFIPSSTIQKCLEIWRTYNHVPRIHLGMKLFGIKCLSLVSKEKIFRKYNVDAGLIVRAVSAESNAEKLGVRMGDIILSVNGEQIATAVELENKLLDISKAYLEKGMALAPAWM